MDVLVIKTDFKMELKGITDPNSFKEFYPLIGGGCDIVERVVFTVPKCNTLFHLWVDEEGIMNNQPQNDVASALVGRKLFGNGIVTTTKGEDITGLTAEEISLITGVVDYITKIFEEMFKEVEKD